MAAGAARSTAPARAAGLLLAYGLIYAATYWSSVRFGVIASGAGATATWVPSGVAVATLLMVRDRRWWPLVLAVGAASELLTGWALFGAVEAVSVAVAAGNALEALIVASLVRLATGRRTPDLRRARDVVVLGLAAAVGPAVNAAVTLPAFDFSTWVQGWNYFRIYWLGDVTGIVAIVPVVLTFAAVRARGRGRPSLLRAAEATGLLTATVLVLFLIFGRARPGVSDASAVALLWPLLAWSAFRLGPAVTSVLSLGLIMTADVLTRAGRGPFGELAETGGSRVAALQGLLIVMALSSVALAAVLYERGLAETALARAGDTDPVTGLATLDVARRGIEQLRGMDARTAVLVIDLDAFEHVNRTYGYGTGDEILRQVGQRLWLPLRTGDVVARDTGDAFVVVIGRLTSLDSAHITADRVLTTLVAPFVVGNAVIAISACSGLAVLDERETADDVLARGHVALEQAQARGPGRAVSLDLDAYGRLDDARRLQGELPRALADHQLQLHYQPIVDVHDLHVVGVEALLRWQHPEHGLLPAGRFVPGAEASGLVVALDNWVIPHAVADLARLRDLPGLGELTLFLNVSARTLTEAATIKRVKQALREHGQSASSVVVEITETALVQDSSAGQRAAEELAAEGLRLAIDDFGQGHNALARLRSLPISVIKIDQAFVAGLGTHEIDDTVVRWTTMLARELRMSTVAEGIEGADQLKSLAGHHVDLAQGFWLAPPMPVGLLHSRVTQVGTLVSG